MKEGQNVVVVVGAGTMGCGIAQLFLQNYESVILLDQDTEAIRQAKTKIRDQFQVLARYQLFEPENIEEAMAHLTVMKNFDSIEKATIVVEAVPENLELKQKVFQEIEKFCDTKTILATNTSGISINKIASGLNHPERMVGTHFFMPAGIIPLVEVIRSQHTNDVTVDRMMKVLEELGKEPVLIQKDVPGFVANRIQHAIMREALSMQEANVATSEDIDKVVRYSIGLRFLFTGPFEQRDLNGLDVHYNIASYLYEDLENRGEPSHLLAEKVKQGDLGLKSGKGFYDWEGRSSQEIHNIKNEELLQLVSWLKKKY